MFVWEMAEYTNPGYQKEYRVVFFLIPTGEGHLPQKQAKMDRGMECETAPIGAICHAVGNARVPGVSPGAGWEEAETLKAYRYPTTR